MDLYASFLEALSKAREDGSFYRLSKLSGVSSANLSRWLHRKAVPKIDGLDAIAPLIGWPGDEDVSALKKRNAELEILVKKQAEELVELRQRMKLVSELSIQNTRIC